MEFIDENEDDASTKWLSVKDKLNKKQSEDDQLMQDIQEEFGDIMKIKKDNKKLVKDLPSYWMGYRKI